MNIDRPTLLLDRARCLRNLRAMRARAEAAGVGFRPHFKTHQSRAVGEWFRAEGVRRITVSSVAMAEYFATAGWEDILVAFPFNPRALARYDALAARCRLGTLIDHPRVADWLRGRLAAPLDYYVDIDAGYGRTGVPVKDAGRVAEIIETARAEPRLRFRGFYCHPGDTYHHARAEDRREVHRRALEGLAALKERFAADQPRVLLGDTPGCSGAEAFPGVDEITPGNFIFYDLFQATLGACAEDDIAVAMACPVVGHYPERGEIVVHGGSVHFSKDAVEIDGAPAWGKLVSWRGEGWGALEPACYLRSVSQEHGIVPLPAARLSEVRIGDLVHVLPVHSCLAADAMGAYLGVDGRPVDHMRGSTKG